MICAIHNKEFKTYTSKTTGKPYQGHYVEGQGMCFPPKGTPAPKEEVKETREKINETDWDEIARGKIRSLFIQSHIQRAGMVPLSPSEKLALDELVELAMSGV